MQTLARREHLEARAVALSAEHLAERGPDPGEKCVANNNKKKQSEFWQTQLISPSFFCSLEMI